jgi:hypothetical protein
LKSNCGSYVGEFKYANFNIGAVDPYCDQIDEIIRSEDIVIRFDLKLDCVNSEFSTGDIVFDGHLQAPHIEALDSCI